MKAAIIHEYEKPPWYGSFPEPSPSVDEVRVRVHAAALSNLVKGQAAGKHYTQTAAPPFVPGVDGVGRLDDGRRVYFIFPTVPYGSMAEQTVVRREYCIPLPDTLDDVTAAAAANPGMSAWAALTERADFQAGESVLVNGATGVAGRMAIQIAKHLGASNIVATGRNHDVFPALFALGADVVLPVDQSPDALADALENAIKDFQVSVVLDYLWGPSGEALVHAIGRRGEVGGEAGLRYMQIGSIAGANLTLPAAALRSAHWSLMGSGIGSVSKAGLVRSISGLMNTIVPAGITVDARPVPLTEAETVWNAPSAGRVVFTM